MTGYWRKRRSVGADLRQSQSRNAVASRMRWSVRAVMCGLSQICLCNGWLFNADSHSAACAPTQPEPSHQPASQPSHFPRRTPAPSAALCAHHNTPRPPPAPRPHLLEVRTSAHCALSDARSRSIRVRCRRRRRAGGAGRRVAPRRVAHARVATVSTTSPRFHIAWGRVGRPAHTPPALIDAEGDHQDDEGTHMSTSTPIYAVPYSMAVVYALSGAD